MWGRFFPQALNIIAGSEKPARASGRPHGAGFWIIEDYDLSGQACSLPKRDEDTAGWGKAGLLGGVKGRVAVPKLGVEGSSLNQES